LHRPKPPAMAAPASERRVAGKRSRESARAGRRALRMRRLRQLRCQRRQVRAQSHTGSTCLCRGIDTSTESLQLLCAPGLIPGGRRLALEVARPKTLAILVNSYEKLIWRPFAAATKRFAVDKAFRTCERPAVSLGQHFEFLPGKNSHFSPCPAGQGKQLARQAGPEQIHGIR